MWAHVWQDAGAGRQSTVPGKYASLVNNAGGLATAILLKVRG